MCAGKREEKRRRRKRGERKERAETNERRCRVLKRQKERAGDAARGEKGREHEQEQAQASSIPQGPVNARPKRLSSPPEIRLGIRTPNSFILVVSFILGVPSSSSFPAARLDMLATSLHHLSKTLNATMLAAQSQRQLHHRPSPNLDSCILGSPRRCTSSVANKGTCWTHRVNKRITVQREHFPSPRDRAH